VRLVLLASLGLAACTAGEVGDRSPDGGAGDGDGGGGGDGDAGPAEDTSDELYAQDSFPRFDLTLPQESIDALTADPATYATADFSYGDETVASVGVRLKGEYTFRPLTAKASFKIKFDEFVPDQRFRGLARMTLNNGFEDPSLIAERLVYLAFRNAGLPAPRANSAQVYVNGELYGVYVNIETEDKTFLRRYFDSDQGNLYEEQGNDWLPGNEQGFELETNETVDDRSDLTALFAAVDGAADDTLQGDVGAIVDGERFLRYCALEGIVNQWDGYAYTRFGPNNYRMYHDPSTGQFSVLPWGMDMSMKPFPEDGTEHLDLTVGAGRLLQRCLGSGTCRAAYADVIVEEANRFEALGLDAVAEAAYQQIHDAVLADPRIEHSAEEFDSAYDLVSGFVVARPDAVRGNLP
jgi:spore coat protein CotH